MSIAFHVTLNFPDSTCVDQSKMNSAEQNEFWLLIIRLKDRAYKIDWIEGENSILTMA
ncbi:hypothetical protein MASR1M31_11490 [Porphyromonadaceae bacterium]